MTLSPIAHLSSLDFAIAERLTVPPTPKLPPICDALEGGRNRTIVVRGTANPAIAVDVYDALCMVRVLGGYPLRFDPIRQNGRVDDSFKTDGDAHRAMSRHGVKPCSRESLLDRIIDP